MKRRIYCYRLVAVLPVIASALILSSFQGAQAADRDEIVATHSQGGLRVTIHYSAAYAGTGQLTVEVLNSGW
jgi:hypothetical protein